MIRVLLDARQTRQMSVGMKRYVRELTARLPRVAPEFEYVPFVDGGNFGLREQVGLPYAIARSKVQLVHFMSIYTPLWSPAPSVVTVHDLVHLLYPQYFKAKIGPYYRIMVRHACRRASRVITDDDRTVYDLERYLGVDRKKVRVIPLGTKGLRAEESRTDERAIRPYFLYVGNHRPHKNLQTLIDAWRGLPAGYGVDLCFTGPDDFGGTLQRVSSERREARALGDLSEEELAARYREAAAVVLPALREGFGLPILEAMAAGTPVVVSAESLPRALEGGALPFPARDVGTLTARLMEILSDQVLRERLVNEGRMLARLLTWDRCARATADVYREVLG